MFKLPINSVRKLNLISKENLKSIVFIVAGLEGNCECFQGLAEQLQRQFIQVFALEYSNDVPTDSVESISKYYIKIIETELLDLNISSFNLAGYSYGGLISLEICRQLEINKKLKIENLIIIESSHTFFRYGVHSNSKEFGMCITNEDIFLDQKVYTGTLSIYLSYLVGASDKKFRLDLYKFLNNQPIQNLDEALDKSFSYIISNGFFEFDNEKDILEKKLYIKNLMLKSNAALVYTYDTSLKLQTKLSLIKTKIPLYKDFNLFYLDTNGQKFKLNFNLEDFDLKEIILNLENFKIFILSNGNHFTFPYESPYELTQFFLSLIMNNHATSKI
ncbi:unnamed protein product [Brachionus calyciflorus]|uniref:oleoyl-[acyl-carrier-protein] hydrolase n=1 Tax=Brachionus calyciflorus TaxID=104777 RepID=A0A813W847_9BILA|nr:unnamed protein product [Brachionus calyciflorus]